MDCCLDGRVASGETDSLDTVVGLYPNKNLIRTWYNKMTDPMRTPGIGERGLCDSIRKKSSLVHLVRAQQQRLRNREPNCLRSLHFDGNNTTTLQDERLNRSLTKQGVRELPPSTRSGRPETRSVSDAL